MIDLKEIFKDYTLADWFLLIATAVLITVIFWAVLVLVLIIGGAA